MNISSNTHCYGCGVCAVVCPRHIIEIVLSQDGFYQPKLTDLSRCTDCGLCAGVCSYQDDELSLKSTFQKSYAAWSKDSFVRRKSSSGGVAFEMGHSVIDQGNKVVGCRYNVGENRAEHYVAATVEELIQSMGSKYIQSYTVDGFRQINRKERYLVTGTPCQIDSFRRYIQKFRCEENFVLMDFFCHGVPSKRVWDKYVQEVEKKVGRLTYVSWRNKFTGWHDSWAMSIDGEKCGEPVNWHDSYNMLIKEKKGFLNSRLSEGDVFYKSFLGNHCLGRPCYTQCKFKYQHSSADIRIGDMWGKTYQDDEKGVSCAIAFTEKGDAALRAAQVNLIEYPFEVVAEGQIKQAVARPRFLTLHYRLLRSSLSLAACLRLFRFSWKIERLLKKLSI